MRKRSLAAGVVRRLVSKINAELLTCTSYHTVCKAFRSIVLLFNLFYGISVMSYVTRRLRSFSHTGLDKQ